MKNSPRLEELLDRFGPRVQALARRYACCESDAEDLTQEIFLAVFRGLPTFRGEADIGTWITRIALNRCLKWREKHARQPLWSDENEEIPCLDMGGDPPTQLARGELKIQLGAALEKLSEPHRQIVILHEIQGLTYAQCAQILEIPVGTVKSRLWNAFRLLRSALEPYLREETREIAGEKP